MGYFQINQSEKTKPVFEQRLHVTYDKVKGKVSNIITIKRYIKKQMEVEEYVSSTKTEKKYLLEKWPPIYGYRQNTTCKIQL